MAQLVSVIIPLFNSVDFIEETILSIINQTYSNIEVIVVDDGSDDGSYEKVKNLNLRTVHIYKNEGKGACVARNYGFQKSSGDLIQYLDSDDLLSADKIANQVADLNNQVTKVAVCSTVHFFDKIESGIITDTAYLSTTDNPERFLLNLYGSKGKPNMVAVSAWLTPRNLIDKAGLWNEILRKDQDGEFFCRVLTRGDGIIYTEGVYSYYRKHLGGGNISSGNKKSHLRSQINALKSKEKQFFRLKESEEYHNAMALQYKLIAIDAWPKNRDISYEAMAESGRHGGSEYLPILGGKIIETMKKLIGWRIAKAFSYYIHKLL